VAAEEETESEIRRGYFPFVIFYFPFVIEHSERIPVYWIGAQDRAYWQKIANDKSQMENGKSRLGWWESAPTQSKLSAF